MPERAYFPQYMLEQGVQWRYLPSVHWNSFTNSIYTQICNWKQIYNYAAGAADESKNKSNVNRVYVDQCGLLLLLFFFNLHKKSDKL